MTQPKKPLSEGDRVRVYGTVPCEVNPRSRVYKRGEIATVTKAIFDDEVTVRTKFGETQVHPKQCRRLKPRAPRRRIWVRQEQLASVKLMPRGLTHTQITGEERDGFIPFIELRRGKSK